MFLKAIASGYLSISSMEDSIVIPIVCRINIKELHYSTVCRFRLSHAFELHLTVISVKGVMLSSKPVVFLWEPG